jgi:hypothetical protein
MYSGGGGSSGAFGAGGGGTSGDPMFDYQEVPEWEQHVTLSPEQQGLLDQQTKLGGSLNSLATSQVDKLGGILGTPLNLDGLPNAVTSLDPKAYSGDRQRYEQAVFDRINPQLDRDRAGLETKLVNQGLVRGTGAFNSAMDESSRQSNDARLGAIAQGGQEQSSALARALQTAQFQNTGRQNALQERMAVRETPINEVGALMGGGQVSMPQFTPFQAGQVAGTPVGDYVYKSAQMAQDNYKTQTAANASSMGSLFGLGSSALGLLMKSDRRLKRDIRPLTRLPNGLTLYAYRFAGELARTAGVMADEVARVKPWAVHRHPAGFDMVDYVQALA